MRHDLGHDDSDLARGELLRVFMEGFDKLLVKLEAATASAVAAPASASGSP